MTILQILIILGVLTYAFYTPKKARVRQEAEREKKRGEKAARKIVKGILEHDDKHGYSECPQCKQGYYFARIPWLHGGVDGHRFECIDCKAKFWIALDRSSACAL